MADNTNENQATQSETKPENNNVQVSNEAIKALGQLAQKVTKNDISDVKALNNILSQIMKDSFIQTIDDENLKNAIANVQNAAKAAETNTSDDGQEAENDPSQTNTNNAQEVKPQSSEQATEPATAPVAADDTSSKQGTDSNAAGDTVENQSLNSNQISNNLKNLAGEIPKIASQMQGNQTLTQQDLANINKAIDTIERINEQKDPRAERIKRIKQIYSD